MSRSRNPHTSTVEDTVVDYLDSLDSGGSRVTMRSPLKRFADYCDRAGITSVEEIETKHIQSYGRELRKRTRADELKASTAQTYFKYIRAFLSFCVRTEQIDTNPAVPDRATEYLPEDKGDRKQQVWTERQRKRLVNYATERVDMALDDRIDVPRERAYRDRAIVVLIAEAGIRGAELFADSNDPDRNGITWGDVDLDEAVVRVFGKSRQYEDAILPSDARTALERYEGVLNPPSDDWPVFPTAHAPSKAAALPDDVETGETPVDELLREHAVAPPSITKVGARRVLKRLTKEAGIDVDGDHDYLEPHGARRSLGRDLYSAGLSERAQEVLRHKSIETTHDAYSHLDKKETADKIDEVRGNGG